MAGPCGGRGQGAGQGAGGVIGLAGPGGVIGLAGPGGVIGLAEPGVDEVDGPDVELGTALAVYAALACGGLGDPTVANLVENAARAMSARDVRLRDHVINAAPMGAPHSRLWPQPLHAVAKILAGLTLGDFVKKETRNSVVRMH